MLLFDNIIKQISRYIPRQNRFLKNFMVESVLFIFSTILFYISRFSVNLFAAHWLGPSTYGTWNSFSLVLTYTPLLTLGTINAMNRNVPLLIGKGEIETAQYVMKVTLSVTLGISTVIGIIATFLSICLWRSPTAHLVASFCMLLISQQLYLYLQTWLKCSINFFNMSYQQLLYAILSLPIVSLGVFLKGLDGYIWGQTLVTIAICVWIVCTMKAPFSLGFDWQIFSNLIRDGFPILAAGTLYGLLTTVDRLVIVTYMGTQHLGYYSLAIMLSSVLQILPMAVGQQMYTRMARRFGESSDTTALQTMVIQQSVFSVVITLPVIAVVYIGLPWFVKNFLPDYLPGVEAAQYILLGFACLPFSGGIANFLNVVNKQSYYLIVQAIGIVLNFLLVVTLVKAGMGLVGVSIGVSLALFLYTVMLITVGVWTMKKSTLPNNNRHERFFEGGSASDTVLFVTSTSRQVEQFLAVANQLTAKFAFLSLDSCYGFNAISAFKPAQIQPLSLKWQGHKFSDAQPLERWWMLYRVSSDIDEILDTIKPVVIVLGNDIGPIERLIILRGKERKIPTLLAQDGAIGAMSVPHYTLWRRFYQNIRDWMLGKLGLPGLRPVEYGSGGCDFVAAMDRFSYEFFLSRGYAADKVRITGQPRYDSWWFDRLNVEEWRDKFELPQEDIIAIFVPGEYIAGLWDRLTQEAYMNTLLQSVLSSSEGHIVILKVHPLDDIEYYLHLSKKWGWSGRIRIVQAVEARLIVELSSLVIVYNSTVGIEALLLDKPVFVADFLLTSNCLVLDTFGAFDIGAALRFRDPSSLAKGIENFFSNHLMRHKLTTARRVWRDYFPELTDGKAASRVAQFISELAELHVYSQES